MKSTPSSRVEKVTKLLEKVVPVSCLTEPQAASKVWRNDGHVYVLLKDGSWTTTENNGALEGIVGGRWNTHAWHAAYALFRLGLCSREDAEAFQTWWAAADDKTARERLEAYLREKAKELGFELVPRGQAPTQLGPKEARK